MCIFNKIHFHSIFDLLYVHVSINVRGRQSFEFPANASAISTRDSYIIILPNNGTRVKMMTKFNNPGFFLGMSLHMRMLQAWICLAGVYYCCQAFDFDCLAKRRENNRFLKTAQSSKLDNIDDEGMALARKDRKPSALAVGVLILLSAIFMNQACAQGGAACLCLLSRAFNSNVKPGVARHDKHPVQ